MLRPFQTGYGHVLISVVGLPKSDQEKGVDIYALVGERYLTSPAGLSGRQSRQTVELSLALVSRLRMPGTKQMLYPPTILLRCGISNYSMYSIQYTDRPS